MVTVPERAGPEFAETPMLTVPFPAPVAPLFTLIQPTLLDAVHSQPATVLTATLPLPPIAA